MAALISVWSMLLWKYYCFGKKFFGDWCSEIYWKKVRWQNWMAANFNARKMYSTIERMEWLRVFYRDNYSTFERTHTWNQLFSEINILLVKELLKQWLTTSSPVKINTVPFKEWMTAILLVKKKEDTTLLQRMNG